MSEDDRPFFKKWFYILRAKYRAWNYKRKYGINIEDGILEYGKRCVLNEQVGETLHRNADGTYPLLKPVRTKNDE